MESLLERIQENRLDALYLFINEELRQRDVFDRFIENLMSVLPQNWSIQRVEVGHEFLSMVEDQERLFGVISELDALRTIIVSDGYVPRKDKGTIHTKSLLNSITRARNLATLDLQRVELATNDDVNLLAEVVETMEDSLEEVRITGLFLGDTVTTLDPLIEAFVEMSNLKILGLSTMPKSHAPERRFIGQKCLLDLCSRSSSLQDLSLRCIHLDDVQCQTIARAMSSDLFLTSLDIRQNSEISNEGYQAILDALEINFEAWCAVMVDVESYQHRFNALIELNQAGRGDLLRSPTKEKFISFLEKIHGDTTSTWYFLRIHDTLREPFIRYWLWKSQLEQQQQQQQQKKKRTAEPNSTTPNDGKIRRLISG